MQRQLNWEKMQGLIPAIVQDSQTLQVLMLGYVNAESWQQTLTTQKITFWSRSQNKLWQKGETSGHILELVDYKIDCDGDALLLSARPVGPTCHLQTTSCFGNETAPGIGFLPHLQQIIANRLSQQQTTAGKSYTRQLVAEGLDRVIQKVGEEAIEVVIAAKNTKAQALTSEISDLVYHLLILLQVKQLSLQDIVAELSKRHKST